MTYRATDASSTQTAMERRQEADRILAMFEGAPPASIEMTPGEAKFIFDISDPNAGVSVKQLWWLRDLRDKYLL